MAIDGQVCFNEHPITNPVNPRWFTTAPVEPGFNENAWGAKLLPTTVSAYPMDCIYLLKTLPTTVALNFKMVFLDHTH